MNGKHISALLLFGLIALVSLALAAPEEEVEQDSLRLAIIVHRHGDRTPVLIPEGHQERWPLGPGQLTGTGVHQLWELGDQLRGMLDGFLDTTYAPGVVYSRASNKDRTLQSAEAMLMALFPPGYGPTFPFEATEQASSLPESFQPVPTHSVELERDHILRGYQNCPRYDQYMLDTFYNAPAGEEATLANQELLDELADVFDADVSLKNLDLFYDYLWCSDMHDMQDLVSDDVFQQTVDLYNWVYSQDFTPNDQSRLIGGPLIGQVLDDMQSLIRGDDSTKAKLYSAHDVTLGTLRAVLGLESTEVPPYASWAMFELHRISNEWVVKFTYNGEVEALPFCKDILLDGYCPLEAYESALRSIVPEDPEAECSLDFNGSHPTGDVVEDDEDEGESSPLVSSFLIIAVLSATEVLLLIVVAILLGYIYVIRKDRFVFVHRGTLPTADNNEQVEVELEDLKARRSEAPSEDV